LIIISAEQIVKLLTFFVAWSLAFSFGDIY